MVSERSDPVVDDLPLWGPSRLPVPPHKHNSNPSLSRTLNTGTHHIIIMSNHKDQASTNYKEAFSLFDRRGTGRVAGDLLGDLLRACGQNPTLAEIGDLEKSVGGDCMFSL